jgi:hypothetical protein
MPHFTPAVLLALLLCATLVVGCAEGPTVAPTLLAASATPSHSSTDIPTLTPILLSTATSFQIPADAVRIQNAAKHQFLYDAAGQTKIGDLPASDTSTLWVIEDYHGSKRIRNVASGNYLSIEHLKSFIEVIPVRSDWMSPRWTFEADTASGATVLRNVWHNWQVLLVKDGQVVYDHLPTSQDNARWLIQPVNGVALATPTTTPVAVMPTASEPASSRGANVPWIEYEAEAGETTGEILKPDRTFGTFSAESSGRSAVKLSAVEQYVQFISQQQANSVVVRYIIPDSADGAGLDATLSLYINGTFRQKLQLTSKYSWSYGGEEYTFNTPAAGGAHHFYDEARALTGDIPAGATVKFQVDTADTAAYYVIDLVDLEQVAPPKTQPAGYVSIADFGAVPNDAKDDGDAIRQAIQRARTQKTGVWIPAGTYESSIAPFDVSDVTIQGAGMWYSTLHGMFARFNCTGSNCRFFDFAILGETLLRDDNSPENGFNGGAGSGSRLENIWVEHTKVGYWVGPGTTDGLVIINSRFRDLYADGVNFCNGTSNSVIENSHFRNTGDDAMASWSPKGSGVNTNNVFRFNTVQVPWRANCIAIYGGVDNKVEDNLCYDVVTYPGILIAQQFNSNPFGGTTLIQRNSLIRAGGPMFHQQHGALKLWADQGAITGVVVKEILIDGATFTGIELVGSYPIQATTINSIQIQNPGTDGIFLHSNLSGEVEFSSVSVTNPGKAALTDNSPKLKFNLIKGSGNTGW